MVDDNEKSSEKPELTIEEHFSAVLKEHGARLAELASSRHTRIEAGLLSEETGLPIKLNTDDVYIPWSYYVKFKDLDSYHAAGELNVDEYEFMNIIDSNTDSWVHSAWCRYDDLSDW